MSSEPQIEYDKAAQRRGRLIAAAIMLVVALPMLVAYVVYHTGMGIPAHTVNKGELLVPPQNIAHLQPYELGADQPWDITGERNRWRWVIPGYQHCDTQCEENLYITRQVHIRVAKDAYRVERFYLLLDEHLDESTAIFLAEEHPGLRVVRADPEQLQELLAQTNMPVSDPVEQGLYFLMDQQGYLMMVYNPSHTGNQLLDDIKRMLKVTYDD